MAQLSTASRKLCVIVICIVFVIVMIVIVIAVIVVVIILVKDVAVYLKWLSPHQDIVVCLKSISG